MEQKLISVIIPTRNRQKYAEKTVEQILGLKQNIEIIVQDNSDDDSLFSILKPLIEAKNIKYEYERKTLPFSENYNRATEKATGEYLCAIGDDDGILPNIVSCAEWMEKLGIDAVKPSKDQVYFYPGNSNKKKNSCLGFGTYTGSYYFSNPESALISLLDDGGCNYLEKELPGSYHGLVRMETMKKVHSMTGKYYSGLTPDMYSVACLSLIPGIRFAVLDYPITLPGVCPTSGSAASDSGNHVGNLKDAPHLKACPDYKWSEKVPRYYSVETIWAETLLFAIRKMDRTELIDKYFNTQRLAQFLYQNNPMHRSEILHVLPETARQYIVDSCPTKLDNSNKLSKLLGNAAIKISGKRTVLRGIQDINTATKKLVEQLERF